MNYLVYLTLLNLILISRLRLLFKDEGIDRKDAIVMGFFPFLFLPFLQLNTGWFILVLWLIAYPWLFLFSDRKSKNINRTRVLMLLLHFVVVGVICSPLFNLSLNNLTGISSGFINEVILITPDENVNWMSIQVALFGFLLVINETNILLRYMLDIFRLKPIGKQGTEANEKEYNTGRLIGILERIFVYIFVLLGQFAAIGFILAAKGVARFQDFKSRTFAEYVLIGTLISTLLAMGIGYFVKVLILT